jgi:NAD(P)-dependent dehydrogenase (short-subunit alcohol dehydrogenase family)
MNKTAIVLGVTADIGGGLCERLLADGWRVAGIGRDLERLRMLQGIPDLSLHRCDIESVDSVRTLQEEMSEAGLKWDFFLSCVGTMEPIGKFFELDFEIWAHSIAVNFTAQLRVLHGLWPLRQAETNVDVMLLAGGGTNNPVTNYSAYCVSKIALIKMCELLDDEEHSANIFILGPGYVNTRIHEETLRAGPKAAGSGYLKTLNFLEGPGTSIDEIYQHMCWCMGQGRDIAGGRNFSTVHDPWRGGGADLAKSLRKRKDAFRLRRHQVQS